MNIYQEIPIMIDRSSSIGRLAWRGSGHVKRMVLLLCAWLSVAWTLPAFAGVTPVTSRVVLDADAPEESLQLFNVNKYPVLVQAWVDDGRIDALPEESKAPVLVLPPVFRMSAGEQTSLRLLNTGAPLPTDRESAFWLNLYEIPATPKDRRNDEQTVTITMRTQIKVFVRPAGKLPYPAAEVPKRLTFSLVRMPDHLVLSVDNPTPYHATISAMQLAIGDTMHESAVDMIAPFSRGDAKIGVRAGHPGGNPGGHPGGNAGGNAGGNPGEHAKLKFLLIGDDGEQQLGERDLVIGQPKPAS
ncbi:fimbrial biogenesis chaperone [Burkholderia guangdongensis]|uniref:fimbrial biogenesis chaperone n=1 Tax=Burkholderia guangdongensis TaxID=1792500 RepID=UPI001FE42C67|nr:molecular chaperone [Burkholderia guangdongensis]